MPRGVPNKPKTTTILRLELSPDDEAALSKMVGRLGSRMGFLDEDAAREGIARAALRQGLKWMTAEDEAETASRTEQA